MPTLRTAHRLEGPEIRPFANQPRSTSTQSPAFPVLQLRRSTPPNNGRVLGEELPPTLEVKVRDDSPGPDAKAALTRPLAPPRARQIIESQKERGPR